MRVLCVPDLHCWWSNYDRNGSRLEEWRTCTRALIEAARASDVDIAVAPGDFFPHPRPSAAQVLEIAAFFRALEDAGVPVVGCAGNHDYPGPGQAGPVDLVGAMGGGGRWGLTSPTVIRVAAGGATVAVAVLPWAKASTLIEAASMGDAAQRTVDALVAACWSLAARAAEVEADYRILIGHWAVSEAITGTGEVMGLREPSIPLSVLRSLPFDAVIFGHVHRPQVLYGGDEYPIVLHTGALVRHDFGEAGDPRVAYVVDLAEREVEAVEIPARRFVTWDVPAAAARDAQPPADVRDAIVRVRIAGREDEIARVDVAEIQARVEAAGAHWVEVQVVAEQIQRIRVEGLTERVDPLEALDRWLEMRSDLDEDTRRGVRRAVLHLLGREVAEHGTVAAAG